MKKETKNILTETEKLNAENTKLWRQLKELQDFIKAGKVDALVIPDEKEIKIFTKKTADKTYRVLIEKMNEGAVTLDESGIIAYCNSHFAKMMALPLQKAIGTQFNNFISNSQKEHFNELIKQAREEAVKSEMYMHSAQGNEIPVQMAIADLNLDDTHAVSIIITDLTEQYKNQEKLRIRSKQLEQKNIDLEKANKELETFTYISSHDLQEPLRKIKTFITLLLREEEQKLSPEGKTYLQKTSETAMQMQQLIDDLLSYAYIKSGEKKFKQTNLTKIVEEVIKDFEIPITEKKAVIKADGLCEANIIRIQFRQLLHNLISNSLKFAHPEREPRIIIKSEIAPGSKLNDDLLPNINYCHLSVADNGIGFDPQYKDLIFEVFQRLYTKDEYEGTGMGLAICKRIVENHKGIITATGKPGKGATFEVYIPVE